LLIYLERGFGDGLQMLRFVPKLVRLAQSTTLVVRPELITLIAFNLGTDVNLATREDLPAGFDRYVWSMSLPSLVGGLPKFQPLVAPQPLMPRAAMNSRLRVGISWGGNPRHARDVERSVSLDLLVPLLSREDTQWVSLQVGAKSASAEAYPMLVRPRVPLQSFADTANLIASLDAVVTIDSAVCHLAGSMGVPTCVMLDAAAEFRWALDSSTPWYPTMTLVRQRQQADWAPVVTDVDQWLTSLSRALRRCRLAEPKSEAVGPH
jgi:hypothetical protein